jgi:hypothetical protein
MGKCNNTLKPPQGHCLLAPFEAAVCNAMPLKTAKANHHLL